MKKSKVAFRLAYLGTNYAGFQAQPGRQTVQGAVVEALRRLQLIEEVGAANFTASGRTDKGVHAVAAVISFETENSALAIPRRVNTQLPADIWTWARAEVPTTFNARRDAVLRAYQYVLCDEMLDVAAMREAADLLPGVHNFRNFSLEKRQSAVRTIFSSDVYESAGFIVIDVAADSFVWKMMRKLVSAITLVGKAQRSVEWFGEMLNPDAHAEGIRSAPASGLILARVEYDSIDFQQDPYAKKKARTEVHKALVQNTLMAQVLKRFNERMGANTAN